MIHIGLPKAASTHLQANVFPALLTDCEANVGSGSATSISSEAYHKQKDALEILAALAANPDQGRQHRIISNEMLSSAISPDRPGDGVQPFNRFLEIATRLSPLPKILFIVREHKGWLWSAYIQRYKRGKTRLSFEQFVTRFGLEDLSWADRIDRLRQHFPEVLILEQSAFRRTPAETLQGIADFAELPLNSTQLETMLTTSGRSNTSPQTRLALRTHRFLAANRPLWQTIKIFSLGRIQHREQLTAPLNRLGGERLSPPELPPALQSALADDWAATCERLSANTG
ncbi:hypothetical protein CKO15_01075 [Halorhodospira abdelmalekii]|nr:hypothetical protein [Halorhodospira abdelmalekii]